MSTPIQNAGETLENHPSSPADSSDATFVCVVKGPPEQLTQLRSVLKRIAIARKLGLQRIYLQALLDFVAADTAQLINNQGEAQ